MQPEFGFEITSPNVNMGRLAAFVRIKECPIRSPTQNGRHANLSLHELLPPISLRIQQRSEIAVIDAGVSYSA